MSGKKDLENKIRQILDQQAKQLPPGYFVEGNEVYQLVLGGPARRVGYLKNGIPYRRVIGGPDRPMGRLIGKKY